MQKMNIFEEAEQMKKESMADFNDLFALPLRSK